MCKWSKLLVEVTLLSSLVMVVVGYLAVAPVLAATTDSDKITITGSVLPSATSVTTQLQATNDAPFKQNTEVTYTLSYSSDNTSAIPLTLKVGWAKGAVEGASEPSVELLDYVVGSATAAYGDAAPIVNIQKRTITWSISSLPNGTQTRTVSFKLRTNDSYTGSKKVNFTVKAFVVSPVGVPDKSITRQYLYVPPSVDVPLPLPSPTLSVASVATNSGKLPPNSFQTIAIQSLGAVSVRLNVQTAWPSGLTLHYGLNPAGLTNTLLQPVDTNAAVQQLVLVGLQPATQYYYQINTLTEPSVKSDIFTFTTASQLAAQSATEPMQVTVTQDRTILYTGQSATNPGEVTQPMVVTKNTVVDLSLNIPKSQVAKIVEVLIRSFSVLGASTESLNVDELQSTTSQMTEISPDLYVGKLRTPTVAGSYQVVSRVEDAYGNIIEQEIGSMHVVSPFMVTDAKTRQPLEQAQVTLSVYNENTQLYERLSNVTTAVKNPSFSDKNGIVSLSLFPGKYQADIALPGYVAKQVYFEVGTDSSAGMPQVDLQSSTTLFGGQAAYVLGMVSHVFNTQVDLYVTLAQSERMFQLIFALGVSVFAIGAAFSLLLYRCPQFNPALWLAQPYPHIWQRVAMFMVYGLLQIIGFCGEFFVAMSLLFGFLFYVQLSPSQGIWVLFVTMSIIALWTFDGVFLQIHSHPLKTIHKPLPK